MSARIFVIVLLGLLIISCGGTFNKYQTLTEDQVVRLSAKARVSPMAARDTLSTQEIAAILEKVKKTPVDKVQEREVAVLQTTLGPIVIAFYSDVAPEHCKSFKRLVKAGYFDQTAFHRIIEGFVIQGGDILTRDGDPENDGNGDPGYSLKAEFNKIPHDLGIVSMARDQDPDSGGSQFFICLSRERTARLDGKYTVFGKVIGGLDTVEKLGRVETLVNKRGEKSQPASPVYIERAVMVKR
jgi:cyclophilin family peptidyl-prolyl cis-trans isomerase